MGKFIKGDVVVIPFPFSDMTRTKRRPALVAADIPGEDIILLQITSKTLKDTYAVELNPSDFIEGNLHQTSSIRPNKIFTFDEKMVLYKAGRISDEKILEVADRIVKIFR